MSRKTVWGALAGGVGAAGLALGLFLWGPGLLNTPSRYTRFVGRFCLAWRVSWGMAGPDLLLEATDAALVQSVEDERGATLELVKRGVAELDGRTRLEFARGVGRMLLDSPSWEYGFLLALRWRDYLPSESLKEALCSENPYARDGAVSALVEHRGGGRPRSEIAEMVACAFRKGLATDDLGMVEDSLRVAQYLRLCDFIRERRDAILGFAQSGNAGLRRVAYVCLVRLRECDEGAANEQPPSDLRTRPTSGPC